MTQSTTGSSDQSTVQQVATQGTQATGEAASTVRDTAAEQAQRVGSEARTQARNVASEVRDKLGEQARSQSDQLAGTIRQTADHLDEMRGDRSGTPAATVVARVADGSRQLADYLDEKGPEGVLREVQDFARRRPGAFLATALAAGFVVGRLGKSVAKADPDAGADTGVKPSDTYSARYPETVTPPPAEPYVAGAEPGVNGGYGTGTEYTSTGTGTPLVVEPEYPETRP